MNLLVACSEAGMCQGGWHEVIACVQGIFWRMRKQRPRSTCEVSIRPAKRQPRPAAELAGSSQDTKALTKAPHPRSCDQASGHTCQWSNTERQKACPCAWYHSYQHIPPQGPPSTMHLPLRSKHMGSKFRAHLPVVEDGEAERLPLGVVAQVRLEAEGFQHGEEGLDDEDGGARLWHVCSHVPSSPCQHCVDGCDAVCTPTESQRFVQ